MCVVDRHYEGVLRVLVFLGWKILGEEIFVSDKDYEFVFISGKETCKVSDQCLIGRVAPPMWSLITSIFFGSVIFPSSSSSSSSFCFFFFFFFYFFL